MIKLMRDRGGRRVQAGRPTVPMEEDHLRQGRDEKGVYWEIDRDGCFEWLKNNGYTGEAELAPAVVWCSY